MPKFGTHILIAELASKVRPGKYDMSPNALRLGAIGPDMTLFLFDFATKKPEVAASFKFTMALFDTMDEIKTEIKRISDLFSKDDLTDWITGGLNQSFASLVNLTMETALSSLKVSAAWQTGSIKFSNPFYQAALTGQLPPEVFTDPAHKAPEFIVGGTDVFGFPFRYFGHPFTNDPGWKTPATPGDYSEWWWMDMLHYRRTGDFAKALAEGSSTPAQKSYAAGYSTHLAGDICGHPYINAIVGGPFRNHAYRHMVLEGAADTWLWDKVNDSDILQSALHTKINGNEDEIADLFIASLKKIYAPPMLPDLLSNRYPSANEILAALTAMKKYLAHATSGHEPKPKPPSFSPDKAVQEMLDLLKNAMPGSAPPYGSADPVNSILAVLAYLFKAMKFFIMLMTIPPALLARIARPMIEWPIYLLRLAMYQMLSGLRTFLALSGYGYLGRDDLTNFGFISDWLYATNVDGYPRLMPSQPRHPFYWLASPNSGVELPQTLVAPRTTRTPMSIIDRAIKPDIPGIKAYAACRTTADTRSQYETSLPFGNAVDLSLLFWDGDLRDYNFDLDGDRGLGYKGWDFDSAAGEPYVS